MRVKDCEASDGQTGRHLALSDPEGCIVRPKLLGKFSKVIVITHMIPLTCLYGGMVLI